MRGGLKRRARAPRTAGALAAVAGVGAAAAVAGALWLARRPGRVRLEPVRVAGSSMTPTLADGTLLAVGPVQGPLRRGRLVLVRRPAARGHGPAAAGSLAAAPMELVKRVVGLPGERVTLAGGRLAVDGLDVPESYLPGARGRDLHGGPSDIPFEVRLGAGEYLVLGDHRGASTDGRSFGPIHQEDVIGLVRFVYWPPSAWRPVRVIRRLGISTVSANQSRPKPPSSSK